MKSTGLPFVKGHGTENDFVLLPDPDGTVDLSAELARALCERHTGVGADGVIRVGRDGSGRFVMDYRNADGSPAEMCGNGARVFARFLVDEGWAPPGRVDFVTRGGIRTAELQAAGDVLVHMGPARVGAAASVTLGGARISGVAVDVGNPHVACLIATDPSDVSLAAAPRFDPGTFPDGANVEIVQPLGPGDVRMRVHERGVGETRSCGTGTVAAAAAFLASRGITAGTVTVHIPGGRVTVQLGAGWSTLAGPAVIVARGVVLPDGLPGKS